MESVRALAAVFAVEVDALIQHEEGDPTQLEAVQSGLTLFTDFSGRASRHEYWWFFLFFVLLVASATAYSDRAGQIVMLILLLPFLAAGTRRLHDAGHSGWWTLFWLVPFGQVVVLVMLALKSQAAASPVNENEPDPA